MHTYIRAYIHTRIHTYTQTYKNIHTHTHTHTHTHIPTRCMRSSPWAVGTNVDTTETVKRGHEAKTPRTTWYTLPLSSAEFAAPTEREAERRRGGGSDRKLYNIIYIYIYI